MGNWWVAELWHSGSSGPVLVVSWVVWVLGSIVLHELGHGWAAIRLGDDTPRETGQMTWNPLVHMGGFSLLMFALIGIAWGAMPVDPSRMRGRHADALVALAGPLVNLVLAVVALLAWAVWVAFLAGRIGNQNLADNLTMFLHVGAWLNIVLMLFNLVPVIPLDGGRIVAHYSAWYRNTFVHNEHGRWAALGLFLLLFYFGAGIIFGVAGAVVYAVEDAVLAVLG